MANVHSQMSPRQKMINLMYIVLTAMLALNVSSDVLDGFTKVDEGLKKNNSVVSEANATLYRDFGIFAQTNPAKAGNAFGRAVRLHAQTLSLYNTIDSLKLAIVVQADGENGNPDDIRNRENLDASSIVMLNNSTREGEQLRKRIDLFRGTVLENVSDSTKKYNIESLLSTAPTRVKGSDVLSNWENVKFENQPVVAAVTLLSKLQNDLLYSESEALTALYSSVEANDLRVNELRAFVIPESKIVMRGSPYSADILLGAVDTTARPSIIIDGKKVESRDGHYEFIPTGNGKQTYSGFLEIPLADGSKTRQYFSSEYTVIDPMAAVSPTMMNVLYAGIDNPIDIAVAGMTHDRVNASMTGGNLVKNGSNWTAKVSPDVEEATITVTAQENGRNRVISTQNFKVRSLPDPTPYIALGGNARHKSGKPISKSDLMASNGIGAAIDDGILDITFNVKEFETVFFDSMGNAMLERSEGANFSNRQKDAFKRLTRGKRFFISRIKAVGPDGKERTLSPIEIILN